MSEHHTNGERILYNAVQTAYWACEAGEYDAARTVLDAGLEAAGEL